MPTHRISAMFLCALVITILAVAATGPAQPSLATTATPSPAPPFAWGDTDCNGAIDSMDVIRVLRRAADLQVEPACDESQPTAENGPQPTDTDSGVSVVVDPAELSIPQGETRIVKIVADANSDLIGSWSMALQYDPAVVKPIHCSGICNLDFAPGKVALANISVNGAVLSSVTFKASDQIGLLSNLDLTVPDFVDATGSRLATTVSGGSITVALSRENLDCRNGVTAQDALDLISYIAGLPATDQPSGCPTLGE